MADNLIFPIGFDLEEAVKKAGQEWNSTYADKLEKLLAKRAITVNLGFSTKNLNNLDDVKRRLAELKIEPLTPENKTAIRELVRELKELARIMEKIQKFKGIELPELQMAKAAKLRKDVAQADEKLRLSQERVRQSEERLILSQQRAAQQADRTSKAYGAQSGYLERLIKRMAVYASFSYAGNFLTSVREVTAQFELQRVSLGAILQDANKGAQIFSQIKQFALKSPISILDLTKYTKQLAAYKIGYDELFDTTKRLADVSVGLGVDFQRIVLLYGQVRATGYLRASEVRQATEAGIPLVEELANKLSEANGTLVTSAQVLKMVEERAISFEMVKEVFEDMTNAGGLFYDMQEKQGNTLYGMWQKLGDAAAMMYDEIGNTPWVNEGMKEAINMLRTLMIEWKLAGANIATLGVAVLLYANKTKLATLATKLNTAAITEESTVLRGRILHLKKAIMYQNLFATSTTTATTATKLFTLAQLRLTQALNLVVVGFKKLSAAFMSNIWGIILVGVSLVIERLLLAKDAAKELKNELANINLDYESKQGQDAANLEYLANAAVNAAKGSKAQKDALEELKNTYGKIIPMELLTIENLERMKGNYGELIALIDEYNLKQKYEKETSAIESSFAPEEEKRANKIRNILSEGLKLDYADEATGGVFDKVLELTDRNIQRFLLNLKKYAEEGKDKTQQIVLASQDLGKELGLNKGETEALTKAMIDLDRHELEGQGTLMDYTEALYRKNEALAASREEHEKERKALNEYSAVVDEVMKKNEDEPEVTASKDAFENEKARLNNQISDVASGIVELLNKANVAVDNGTQQILNTVIQNGGMIPDAVWDILEKAAEAANNPKLLAAIQDLREHYKGLAPDDETVNFVKNGFIKIVDAAHGNMKEYRQYLYDGKTTIKEYQDFLQKSISGLRDQVFQMVKVNALIDEGLVNGQKYDEATIKAAQEKADALQAVLDKYVTPLVRPYDKNSNSRGTKSDPRLQILNEMVQLAEKLNKEYSDWEKKVGSTKALEKVNETYAETVKYAEKVAKDAGISLPHLKTPTNSKELNEYLEAVRKVMETAKGLKGGKKAAIELAVKMSNNVSAEDQKAVEEKIKTLADRISRTKTAKEFYEKILGMTGDVELAANVAIHVYGEQGKDLDKQIREQIEKLLEPSGIKIDESIFREDGTFDPKKLREFAEAQKDALGGIESKAYQELIKLSDNADKDFAKTIEGWLKAIEKAKSASDKMLDLARTTRTEIDKITAQKGYAQTRITELLGLGTRTDEQQQELENLQGFLDVADKLIQGFKDKQTKEQTSLAYEMFKDSPMYVQMFDDLDHASTAMLENMKTRIEGLKGAWKDLTPTQLKELQSRMNEIDAQLAKRNPFKTLAKSISDYRKLRREGDSRGNKSEGAANADLMAASKAADEARKKYDELVKKYGEGSEKSVQEVIDAKDKLDRAMTNEEAAQKAVENWKKVKDMIGLSANELFQMLNWAGDIAKGIADISEAMGADEEDVQYWNDVADALGEISGGIQDIVQSAMSGNVVGIISSTLTAIPKMFVGFANLFSAGKIKRANKEIKRQQELLDQLEYTYGRLEQAADKTFGTDYVNNYQQQIKNLQAQQAAYLKQAQAERSKGKKEDKEKTKQFEEQARETADKIKETQDDLVAHFTGSSKTDVARQMAKSWIDARSSMSDTFAAIKGDYQDLIKNMIVEGAAARVIENALSPMWDKMDAMLKDNNIDGAIDALVGGMDSALNAANNGMEVLWKALEARGYDMKKLIGDTDSEYTGIAKSVAGATSEEINSVAAIGNTLMYYVSPIPRIDENLARVVAIMEGRGASAIPQTTSAGWTDWQQQAMDNYNAIARNTSDTVVECRRAAEACERIAGAFKVKGSTKGLNVFLNT